MADPENKTLVQETRESFQKRLEELQPQVNEYSELQQILAVIDGKVPAANGTGNTTRSRGGGRRRGSGNREKQFIDHVAANPGVSVSQAAKDLGIGPNYLYRVAKQAVEAGKVVKEGQGYEVTETASA